MLRVLPCIFDAFSTSLMHSPLNSPQQQWRVPTKWLKISISFFLSVLFCASGSCLPLYYRRWSCCCESLQPVSSPVTFPAWTCRKFPRTAEHAQRQKSCISALVAATKDIIHYAQADHRFGSFLLRPRHCLLDVQSATALGTPTEAPCSVSPALSVVCHHLRDHFFICEIIFLPPQRARFGVLQQHSFVWL